MQDMPGHILLTWVLAVDLRYCRPTLSWLFLKLRLFFFQPCNIFLRFANLDALSLSLFLSVWMWNHHRKRVVVVVSPENESDLSNVKTSVLRATFYRLKNTHLITLPPSCRRASQGGRNPPFENHWETVYVPKIAEAQEKYLSEKPQEISWVASINSAIKGTSSPTLLTGIAKQAQLALRQTCIVTANEWRHKQHSSRV